MAEKVDAPYGTWTSSISSSLLTLNSSKFTELQLDPTDKGKGVVYWTEMRPWESGRTVICSRFTGGKVLEWTSSEFDVANRVHEYGGGAFFVHSGIVYFSNRKDSRLYKQEAYNQTPIAITKENKGYRYADGCLYNGIIYCIREDHTKSETSPINAIVSINVANGSQSVLVEGADFYASCKVNLDGASIVWMQWNHPNMPWDDTELWLANLNDSGTLQAGSERKIAGEKGINFMQPRFSPDGKIFYISDESDWWNLYQHYDLGNQHNVQQLDKELGGPHWQFANDAYSFDPKNSGDVAVSYGHELGIVNLKSELYYKQETGFTQHSFVSFGRDNCIYCVASSSTKFPTIIRWNVVTGETEVIKECRESLSDVLISTPEHIIFRTGSCADDHAFGYFYAPKNPHFKGVAKTLPPLVVMMHGGPTASASPALNLKVQYLTSRGFAVLDVNYRGSTGYGKKYRNLLRKKWGIYDVEDCCSGALHLAHEEKVDGNRLAITGGSAGGYSVLAALTFRNVFKVGASHYGIGDLIAMENDTHKFESKYSEGLIGRFPEEIDEFRKRSPIFSIDKLDCPVIFFQGLEDKVVPPEQAEKMYKALLNKGLPTALVLFEGEAHGFRKAENIQMAVDGEFYFFCRMFNVPVKDALDKKIDIKNWNPVLIHNEDK